jgi:uncharacterized protein
MCAEQKTGREAGHFIVDVERLKDGPATFDCEIPVDWLAAELASCEYRVEPERGRLAAEAISTDSGVLVRGEASARVKTECGVCLAEIDLDLTAPVSAFLVPRPEAEAELGEELTPEDLEREWYDGDRFALDELVRDALVLELPMTPRCAEECRGEAVALLAPAKDRIDPRLAPLASIRLPKEK